MRSIVQSALAGAVALASTLPLHAQGNSSLRPGGDSSVTTGVGTSSAFRNVTPPDQAPPDTSRKFMWDAPDSREAFAPGGEGNDNGKAAVMPAPPPAPEAPENPRTMITRDRIESPQH